MNNNSWFKKQKPFQGFSGFGGGGLGLAFGGSSAPTIEASGGLIGEYTDAPTGDVYRTHTFTTPGKFTVSSVVGDGEIDYLVVGGGGAGGQGADQTHPVPQTPTQTYVAGGGGGGGVATNIPGTPRSQVNPVSVKSGAYYNIKVGLGGAPGSFRGRGSVGFNGLSSVISTDYGQDPNWSQISVYGGGAGQGYDNGYGWAPGPIRGESATGGGGSGKYGGPNEPGYTDYPFIPAPTAQGGDGGDSSGSNGGGGGGAGGDSPGPAGGDGIGMTIENGIDTIYYGGGGGGSGTNAISNSNQGDCGPITSPTAYPAPNIPTTAIAQMNYSSSQINAGGGYGAGGYYNSPTWQPGPPYGQRVSSEKTSNGKKGADGYGQGGGGGTSGNGYGGQGGSGVVVIRYKIAEHTGAAKATGGIIHHWPESPLSPTGAIIHIFRGPGVFRTGSNFADPTNGHPTGAVAVQYMVLGGGGAGGSAGPAGAGGGAGGVLTGYTNQGNDAYGWIQVGQGGQGSGDHRQFNGWGGTDPIAYDFTSANSGCGKDSVFNMGGSAFTGGGGGAGGGGWRVPIAVQAASPPTGAPEQGGGHPAPQGSGGGSVPWSPTGGTGGPQGNAGGDSDGSQMGGGGGAGGAATAPPGPTQPGPTYGGQGSYGGAGVQLPAYYRNPQMATPTAEKGNSGTLFVGGGLGFPGPGGGAHYVAGGGAGSVGSGLPQPDGYGVYGGGPGASTCPFKGSYPDPAMNWYGWCGAGASRGPNCAKNIPSPTYLGTKPTANYAPGTFGYGGPGACNSGSGGGGGARTDATWPPASYTGGMNVGGSGGSGIVLIAYPQ